MAWRPVREDGAQHAEFFVDGGLGGIAEVSAIWGATGGMEAAGALQV